jgi:O-6-methylguanine DNA methyltransferase
MKTEPMEFPVATAEGEFLARYSANGLARLRFPQMRTPPRHLPAGKIPSPIQDWHRLTTAALKTILAGRIPEKFPPLDLAGTAFQKSVWNALRKIPAGQTRSYGEIARAIGRPRAVRAVGGACGANPVPVLVPCHRVLAANQKIGGFSGGLTWKRRLLAREGVKV